jgi:hypothetical protein
MTCTKCRLVDSRIPHRETAQEERGKKEATLKLPPISCMCLTFARPRHLLDEAVFSFLQQDYKGEKELLILNDFPNQTIRFVHPQVTILNLPVRFRTLGEKRNAAAALCKYDLLAVWDDDDVYLPHRLSFSASKYDPKKRFFKPSRALVLDDRALSGPKLNMFHSGSIWHRSLFDEVGGYRHMGSGQDTDLEERFFRVIGPGKDYDIAVEEIFYVYRWSGTSSYHMSGFGKDGEGSKEKTGAEKVLDFALRQLAEDRIPRGDVRLEPHWAIDYVALVEEYVTRLKRVGIEAAHG